MLCLRKPTLTWFHLKVCGTNSTVLVLHYSHTHAPSFSAGKPAVCCCKSVRRDSALRVTEVSGWSQITCLLLCSPFLTSSLFTCGPCTNNCKTLMFLLIHSPDRQADTWQTLSIQQWSRKDGCRNNTMHAGHAIEHMTSCGIKWSQSHHEKEIKQLDLLIFTIRQQHWNFRDCFLLSIHFVLKRTFTRQMFCFWPFWPLMDKF